MCTWTAFNLHDEELVERWSKNVEDVQLYEGSELPRGPRSRWAAFRADDWPSIDGKSPLKAGYYRFRFVCPQGSFRQRVLRPTRVV